ncbi:bifunctional 5,10-methylenetetrahydrofolate dehydrogenase/5,10-methenyltetrahydrofolate cyclohydrolase [Streptomyces sennicomposti]|uniref:bifunctional 5,10-methylenetetrahydrofolate dehydrogenase/5,10-methenyltetrahydrofolate cyclohydrolase n=1 Tax=Streptomyces sennicomposti TaxID=2873384 RepID=UPI0013AAB5D2|nr:bifunctional 5,10-methylenetetrahydrofolate dehydrogenase/5,10-methenyltetrahydrofolate cyclohydrolase [Streptomyces sennicomposti]MBY8868081.1 bifunctional 5,10-methylenetetrahydrofolate dehydrogenase/5,10-methenyltetrahydrofolate cyclohydrolase [Streptomyces sennicomposti]MYS40463.1 bifunctional 5,10-methylene-tetrahydrofolate dehydrogenase/5,10-methylene-tetrahydrofolate cyclohydrolase [Streptomyces sp. SID5998]
MSQARLMDGTALARRIVEQTARRAAELTDRTGTAPCLATVLVGADPASVTYVRMKQNRCRTAGIVSRHVELPAETTTEELVGTLRTLSQDPAVHGILLQHPVGEHIDERAAFEAIAPEKDVDGVTFASFATMSFGGPGFVSCTPGGILRLLDAYDVDLAGKRAVVVGRSAILGKPVGMLLLGRDATVTYCHSRTRDLSAVVREADVVVAAVGRPRLIKGGDVKPGAVVIDAGYNPGNVGDVDFESAAERASLITPVPGGVGPMTIATLLEQTVAAAARQLGV